MWIWTTIVSIFICFIFVVCWRMRDDKWQLAKIARKVERLSSQKDCNFVDYYDSVKHINHLIRIAIMKRDEVFAYKGVELLKTVAGQGGMNYDNTSQLMSLTIAAMRSEQAEVAKQVLDIYRLLLRNAPKENSTEIMEQILNIGVASVRERQAFLLAKAADILLEKMSHSSFNPPNEISTRKIAKIIQILGLLALRRHDSDLFREICVGITQWTFLQHEGNVAIDTADVALIWLHRIVQTDDMKMFEILRPLLTHLIPDDDTNAEMALKVVETLGNLAGLHVQILTAHLRWR